jgi:hypothetical protein
MPRIGRSFPVPPRPTRGPLGQAPIARLPVTRVIPRPRMAAPRAHVAMTYMLPPPFPMALSSVGVRAPRQRHPVARQQVAVRLFVQPSAPGRRLLVGVGR